jgi:co-chaperonin GroES (HSP10)
VKEKEQIQSGYIIKAGPGYPIPVAMEDDEPWKDKDENVKYVPLQAREGDLAIFLQKGAIEVIYQEEKYFIVPQSSILMLEREEDMFE